MNLHRFSKRVTDSRILALLDSSRIHESIHGVALWLAAATKAAGRPDKCCRNALYHQDGRITWLYPNSNTAELISAWLDLAELYNDPTFIERAIAYADGLLNDPVKGLYRGSSREAWGLPWYWTDGGTYSGLYAMRMPYHFHRLYELTGNRAYLEICLTIGQTLLNRQLASGFVSAAWDPAAGWIHEVRIGSRYVYAVGTFATLWRITADPVYFRAYQKALMALLKLQNADGSLYQMLDPRTGKWLDASIKLHFYAYYFNGIAEAYATTEDDALIECARRIADHLCGVFYYQHTTPYCIGRVDEPADQMEAASAVQDAAAGLFWIAEQTNEPVYRDAAVKLWMQAFIHQYPNDAEPGWAGAIIRGIRNDATETPGGVPENRKHLHYDPTVIARSDLWFAIHHLTASKALLRHVAAANEAKAATVS